MAASKSFYREFLASDLSLEELAERRGGVLIIEDIFKAASEAAYYSKLAAVLPQYEHAFFITLDHVNRCSTGWDNDKLLVLIKQRQPGLPVVPFVAPRKLTLITPCSRPHNLQRIYQSIDFRFVEKWIIVYDSKRVPDMVPHFHEHALIHELWHRDDRSIVGNAQRNKALDCLMELEIDQTGFIYFLDDDNLLHPDLFQTLQYLLLDGHHFSFNRSDLKGNVIRVNHIDTAMAVLDFRSIRDLRWELPAYNADGIYLETIYRQARDKWVFVDQELCWYNALSATASATAT